MKTVHLLILLLSVACGRTVVIKECPSTALEPFDSHVLLLADTQLHNTLGRGLRSSAAIADAFVSVAVRPAELNVLSQHVLEGLLEQATRGHEMALVLGDVANIACTSEVSAFGDAMSGWEQGWVMAHGNHDSFLLGNHNTYIPVDLDLRSNRSRYETFSGGLRDEAGEWRPPAYFSWWTPAQVDRAGYGPAVKHSSWPGACATPSAEDVPLNKLAWLSWYAGHLRRQGVEFSATGEAPGGVIEGRATSGPLAQYNFRVLGRWRPPVVGDLDGEGYDFRASWDSYIVQTFTISDHTFVVIDTSADGHAVGLSGIRFRRYAGSRGSLGERQLADIDALLQHPHGSHIVLAGHMPISDLVESGELKRWMKANGVRRFFSAHTHDATSRRSYGSGREEILDLNIGSTTDWPMQAVSTHLNTDRLATSVFSIPDSLTPECELQYRPRPQVGPPLRLHQACSHLIAAERIAAWAPRLSGDWIAAPYPDDCLERRETGERLQAALTTIAQRATAEPGYRSGLICLAAAASRSEAGE